MNNISIMFYKTMKKGIEAAKGITDPEKKASVYAQYAIALASTGLVEIGEDSEIELDAPAKEEAKKDLEHKYERWEYLNEIAEAIEEYNNN